MNRRAKSYFIAMCGCAVALCPTSLLARELRVKTVDAFTGAPVPGMIVRVAFWDESTTLAFTRTSDDKGEFRLKRRAFLNVTFSVAATERNYCTGNVVKKFEGRGDVEAVVPVALKGTPAKLKVAEVKGDFPPDSDEMRFDFLSGDWLPPQGTGVVADVVFKRMPRTLIGKAYDSRGKPIGERTKDALSVCFPGNGNGIQDVPTVPQCQLWIRTAPVLGYSQEYESYCTDDANLNLVKSSHFQKAQCFRIRTQQDDAGSITNGYYGKIYGEFEWFPDSATAPHFKEVRFMYYINPTSLDRNLESDTKEWPSNLRP